MTPSLEPLSERHGEFSGCYRICGVVIRSDFPLPAEKISAENTDIVVRYRGRTLPRVKPEPPPVSRFTVEADRITVEYRSRQGDICRIVCRSGQIDIDASFDPVPGLWYVLLSFPLAAALFLRDRPALHASAVVAGGRAVLLAGRSGSGKSSTVAALLAAGATLLSDDLCVPSVHSGRLHVEPGYPILRIHAETGILLGLSPSELPRIFDETAQDDKRWVDARALAGGFHPVPAPLEAIYLLTGRGKASGSPVVTPLAPALACVELMRRGYGWDRLDPRSRKTFAWCVKTARKVPIFNLTLPEGLDKLPGAATELLRHFRSTAS